MSKLMLDVGLASKLKVAFARNDWTEGLIDKSCEGNLLGQFRQVLLGNASIVMPRELINCDARSVYREGWVGENLTHSKSGYWKWDAKDVWLYCSEHQIGGKYGGVHLRKELEGLATLNAAVLEFLLANPDHIPEEWKPYRVLFWGTVYRFSNSSYVRFLHWDRDEWRDGDYWTDTHFPAHCRAACID